MASDSATIVLLMSSTSGCRASVFTSCTVARVDGVELMSKPEACFQVTTTTRH